MDDGLAHRLPARVKRVDHFLFAADHDRQPRFAGADVAAGDRSVDAVHAAFLAACGDLDGQRRLAGGHVHENRARPAAGQRALGSQE